jgi:type I restriction enzyme S subunit
MSGGTPKRTVDEYWNGEISWVKISDMLQGEIKHTDESITDKGLRESPARLLEPGTLLLSIFATVGRTAVLAIPAATNQAIVGLRIKAENLDQRYLRHYLDSQAETLKSKSRGVAQDNINTSILKNLRIPLPPLEEQRRIAAILDKCNEIQVADRKRRETLGRFQASYFRYLFGEPSKATENWSLKTIASCCKSIQTGPFGSLLHQSDYIQGGIPILNPKHIVNGVVSCGENETITGDKAEELSGYRLEEGDVLLARRGEMGRCAAITRRENGYLCGTGSMFLRPLRDALAPEYLAALLSSKYMRSKLERVAIGTTLLNLNSTIVGDVLIPVPPIELQFRYARFLARLDAIGDITSRSAFACSAVLASIQNTIFPIAGS